MKRVQTQKLYWQEGFEVKPGLFICPYCSKEQTLRRSWGLSIPRNLPIHTCVECGMPMLKPRAGQFCSTTTRQYYRREEVA